MTELKLLKKEDGYWLSIDGETKALINIVSQSPLVLKAMDEAVNNSPDYLQRIIDGLEETLEGECIEVTRLANICDSLHAEIERLQKEITDARLKFQEIGRGEGAFSQDPLIHASNCIDNMKAVAIDWLITYPEPPTEKEF